MIGPGGRCRARGADASWRRRDLNRRQPLHALFANLTSVQSYGGAARRWAGVTAAHRGHDWIAIPNPTYGSFESAPYRTAWGLEMR